MENNNVFLKRIKPIKPRMILNSESLNITPKLSGEEDVLEYHSRSFDQHHLRHNSSFDGLNGN